MGFLGPQALCQEDEETNTSGWNWTCILQMNLIQQAKTPTRTTCTHNKRIQHTRALPHTCTQARTQAKKNEKSVLMFDV